MPTVRSGTLALLPLAGLLALFACGDSSSSPGSASPSDVDFGEVDAGTSTARDVTLTNGSGGPLQVTDIVTAGGAGIVTSGRALPFTLAPGESTRFWVEFAPSTSGDLSSTVSLLSASESEPVALFRAVGKVRAVQQLVANPATIAFGEVSVGERASQQVTLTNSGSGEVRVASLTVSAPGVVATGLPLPATFAPGESATVTLEFAPGAAGAVGGSVLVRADQWRAVSVLDVSGAGVSPAAPATLSAVPGLVDFRDVTVGSFSAQGVTLTNTTSQAVTISEVATTGAGFTASGISPGTILAPGASAALGVKFTPLSVGSAEGAIAIRTAGQVEPLAVVDLAGSGVQAASITSVGVRNATVEASKTVQLQADVVSVGTIDRSVSWSVDPASIGTIDATTGVYTAPAAPGIYRVWATSNADPTKRAYGSVTVTSAVSTTPTAATTPTGPQFYVATTGNDANPGTLAQPWRTIQKAMSSATAGSTVNIRGGTYNERLRMNVQGAAGSYITFQPYGFSVPAGGCGGYTGVACGGEQVILDYAYLGTATDGVPFLMISSKNYVRVQGFTFRNHSVVGSMQQGLRIEGTSSFVEINYNKFLNNKDTSGTWGGANAYLHIRTWNTATNLLFKGNELGGIVTASSEALTHSSTGTVVIEDNYIHDVDGIAIDVWRGGGNATIRRNLLEFIGKTRAGAWQYGVQHNAIYVDGGHDVVIEGNTVRDSGYSIAALSEPGNPDTYNVTIRNNVSYRNWAAWEIGNWRSNTDGSQNHDITVVNNTSYDDELGIVIRPYVSASVTWKNNLIANCPTPYYNSLGWPVGDMNYNLYHGGPAGPDANKVTVDPQLTNAAAGDLRPRSSSPAVNAGDPSVSTADVGSVDFGGAERVLSGRVDVGAYEVQ